MDGAGPNVCVVIPTLNETDTIGELIAELSKLENIHVKTIIVDDGSTDGTLEIVEATSWWDDDVHLINRKRKLGLGTAIRAGIMRALEFDPPPDYIVTMDGDLSHDPQAIPLLVDMCDGESVIIGSRYVEGGEIRGWNASRHIISRGANIVARVFGRIPARDCTSGFRCYGVDLKRAIAPDLNASGYDIQIEVLSEAARRGFRIGEVPIVFRDRENGDSKLDVTQILKYAMTSFGLFMHSYSKKLAAAHR
ncbi:polyprenol monophosphomannose synthase [Candidatus Bathyarchaeota archaeon]|nr:polyprenol monophosphomannose synthase [Candidatus Bathyarchaeota archaeon]MBL7079253.1 polyprenol monophosphomannose synthase [Candidatus Bathyarchaeota archaeon]